MKDLVLQALQDHRIGGQTGDPWYKRPGGTRMPKNFEQTYRCKCREWEGTHAAHETHVAEVLTRLFYLREDLPMTHT